MFRAFIVFILLGVLVGCAKKIDLPDITVRAADIGEFSRFRAELGEQFPAAQLLAFDTATQELKLDAMNREIASAEGRESDMLAVINAKSVHAATLLGWQARRARFLRETALINGLLENELKLRRNAGADGPSSANLARIQTEKNLLTQLEANTADTEQRLVELRASGEKQ